MAESPENAAAAPAPVPPAAPAPAPTPRPSPPIRSGIPPRYDLDAKWDACLDLSIRRVAYASLARAFGGLILFQARFSSVKIPTAQATEELVLSHRRSERDERNRILLAFTD